MPEIRPYQAENFKNSPKIPKNFKAPKEWAFSFKYFRQKEYFGLNTVGTSWFVSFLERLQSLNQMSSNDFVSNQQIKDALRFHDIDWEAKNIPLQRTDFNWVDKAYLENTDDFPFVQIHISKAKGRIVGFWNENIEIFYILLLDPNHNLQPSQYTDYKLRPCNPLSCDYADLINDVDNLKRKINECKQNCEIHKLLVNIPTQTHQGNVILFVLDDNYLAEFKQQITNKSIKEIIELGLLIT
jgi:hypothetical protein